MVQKEFKLFLFKVSILSVALLVIYGILINSFLKLYSFNIFPFLLLYFIVITICTYFILLKTNALSQIKFINRYILLTTIRLFLNIIIIIVYLFNYKSTAIIFVITFLFLYAIYSVFEIISILSIIKKK